MSEQEQGLSCSYSKGRWGPVLPQAAGGKSETSEGFPLHWNVNDKVWRDSAHFQVSWCSCSAVTLWELRIFWLMLPLEVPSRVFSFASLTLSICNFFCFRSFSVTQSSVMKKTWRRSWQYSKVRTGGSSCPLNLTACSEPDYFPQHLDLTSLRFSAK